MAERLTKYLDNGDAHFNHGDKFVTTADVLTKLAAYEDLGTVEELTALKEQTTDARLQLRTATFSTDKGAADLANFILSYLPEAPKEDENA